MRHRTCILLIAAVAWGLSFRDSVSQVLPPIENPPPETLDAGPLGPPLTDLPQASPLSGEPYRPGPAENDSVLLRESGQVQDEEVDPDRARDSRNTFFQGFDLQATWLAAGGASGMGMVDVEMYSEFAMPLPKKTWPLLLTPGFGSHFLDGPQVSDMPPRLYDAYVEFRWIPRFSSEWRLDVAVMPGVYSDFQQSASDSLRITGHAAAIYTWSPTVKLVLGVAYFDRPDANVLPVGGIVWKPNDDVKFELVAPRPKISYRLDHRVEPDATRDWVYLAGEWGGGTWAIRRVSGIDDQVTYGDYRILLGFQRDAFGGPDFRMEVGYVFGRRLEYVSQPHVDLTPTFLVRGGVTF